MDGVEALVERPSKNCINRQLFLDRSIRSSALIASWDICVQCKAYTIPVGHRVALNFSCHFREFFPDPLGAPAVNSFRNVESDELLLNSIVVDVGLQYVPLCKVSVSPNLMIKSELTFNASSVAAVLHCSGSSFFHASRKSLI